MANYYNQPGYGPSANNLQFFPSSYMPGVPPGATAATPSQPGFGGYGAPPSHAYGGGVAGRMGEHGGLRTGWLAAFSTEGYEGEPPLMEELGINFGHIRAKVCSSLCLVSLPSYPSLMSRLSWNVRMLTAPRPPLRPSRYSTPSAASTST